MSTTAQLLDTWTVPTGNAIAYGHGAVWVATGGYYGDAVVLNPTTGAQVASLSSLGGAPTSIDVCGSDVLFTMSGDSSVRAVDGPTRTVRNPKIVPSGNNTPSQSAYANGEFFTIQDDDRSPTVVVSDPTSLFAVAAIDLRSNGYIYDADNLTADPATGLLYAAARNTVYKINPVTRQQVGTLTMARRVSTAPGAMTVAGTKLYIGTNHVGISSNPRGLAIIDLPTWTVVWEGNVPSTGSGAYIRAAAWGSHVYVTGGGNLYIYPVGSNTPVQTITGAGDYLAVGLHGVFVRSGTTLKRFSTYNTTPNAAALTSMHDGQPIDRANTNRATHTFSDPDAGDSQSAFDERYRLVGSSTWTTAYHATPNQFVDYPAGTFAAGLHEREVLVYDSQGVPAADWSATGYFTAADAPATPTITDPIHNETISAATRPVTWSAPSQDGYQLQVLDGGLVEYDTGTVVTSSRTAFDVPYATNNVTRTTRVRVGEGSPGQYLWSDWYAIANPISYTQSPAPTRTLTGAGTALVVAVTNPTPDVGEPAVTHNEIWIDDGKGKGEERRVAALPPNGSWPYPTPISGRDYSSAVRVVAVAENGTRRSSS